MTIWAWIGWAAALAMLGDDEGSLAKLAEGIEAADFEGPTVFVYRGEIYRRLGRFEEAMKDLDIATDTKPERISAWINRVLLDHAMGNDDTCKVLGRAIRRTNPGAWWDASAQIGTEPLSLNHAPQVLEALLSLMQGNRSSAIPTIVVKGQLRTIRWRVEDIPDELKSLSA
jgi:tetratricopeptide (TPR) repeat protein